jgi:hypothetical protein
MKDIGFRSQSAAAKFLELVCGDWDNVQIIT